MSDTTVNQGMPKPGQGQDTGNASGDADLDTLIAEYEGNAADKPPAGNPVMDTLRQLKPVIDFATDEQAKRANDQIEGDLKTAYEFIRNANEDFKDIDDDWLHGYFEAFNRKHKDAFAKAWNGRHEDPSAWQAQLAKAADDFPEALQRLGMNKVRSDVEAAKAAVSGTSNRAVEAPEVSPTDLFAMSDQDFEKHKANLRAKAAG